MCQLLAKTRRLNLQMPQYCVRAGKLWEMIVVQQTMAAMKSLNRHGKQIVDSASIGRMSSVIVESF